MHGNAIITWKSEELDVIKVGICNLDPAFAAQMETMLSEILMQYDEWMLESYTTETLLAAADEHTLDCKLLIMDVFDPDGSQERVAAYLEQTGCKTDIIYITDAQDKVMSCYQDRAYAYIMKPLHDSDMRREIARYFLEQRIHQRCIRITFNGQESYISIDQIRYVESAHRKVIIHTADKQYEYYTKLDDMETELAGEHFIRCHQSYLVSAGYIQDYRSGEVCIAGKWVPVSRRYRQRLESVIYQAELAATGAREQAVSHKFVQGSVHQLSQTKGSLICVKGEYIGKIIRLVPEQTVIVGRSGQTADIVVNLPRVSRQHCKITYHEQEDYYEISDCSLNGTFVDGDRMLRRGDVYAVKPGTTIVFGDDRYIYRLG